MQAPVIDAVVIGRNEGARLLACLASLQGQVRRLIYVDSGSSDGSVSAARAVAAEVVELDMARPFTAARARNAGLEAVFSRADAPEFLLMLDGDCALQPGFVAAALLELAERPAAALVFGRRRERFPEASVYNRLCDWEWDVPLGEVTACGGDMLIRAEAMRAVGGYREEVIAAEDDELCQRLRDKGWSMWRIAAEMTLHDAAILRFGQWWRRAVRAGHGFAQVGALHPGHFVAARRRVWIWGAVLPLLVLLGALVSPWISLMIALLYGLSFARGAVRFRKGGMVQRDAIGASALITLSKFPNLQGVLTYHWRQLRGSGARIIEYK
jgi:GT2 family glycosyltransferase